MKSILYVGATLMIGASIYGFVDYKQTSKEKEFKGMYTEKKEDKPVVIVEDNTTNPVETNEVTVADKKTAVTKKKAVKAAEEEMLPEIKPVPADQKLVTDKKELIGKEEVTVVPAEEHKVTVKKKRKISTKAFSRAPLREEYDEELPVSSKKKDLKKMEIKD